MMSTLTLHTDLHAALQPALHADGMVPSAAPLWTRFGGGSSLWSVVEALGEGLRASRRYEALLATGVPPAEAAARALEVAGRGARARA